MTHRHPLCAKLVVAEYDPLLLPLTNLRIVIMEEPTPVSHLFLFFFFILKKKQDESFSWS